MDGLEEVTGQLPQFRLGGGLLGRTVITVVLRPVGESVRLLRTWTTRRAAVESRPGGSNELCQRAGRARQRAEPTTLTRCGLVTDKYTGRDEKLQSYAQASSFSARNASPRGSTDLGISDVLEAELSEYLRHSFAVTKR